MPLFVLRSARIQAALWAAALSFTHPAPAAAGEPPPERSQVFVLATLYGRHDSTPAYGRDALRRIIESIGPEVVVLDVSPRELREQSVHPSKREYPEVIFPLVEEHGYRAYAGEPDEPEFTRIVQGLGDALRTFRSEHEDLAAADRSYEAATWAALARLWQSPADVNGALTDHMLSAYRRYQDRLAGPAVAQAWRLWHEHAVTMVRQAHRENPGRRILVLIGVANCAALRAELRGMEELELVDMERWLREREVS